MGGLRQGTLEVAAEQATTWGVRGLVLAAAPLAAALGAEAMRAGGNAYDGAVTAALAETVLLPPKCGLAGDLVALVSRPGHHPEALLAIGGAAAGLAESVRAHGLEATGARAVGVPGAPAGYAALAGRGRLPLPRLTAPAVELAREGFIWARICTSLAIDSLDLVRRHNLANRYFPDWSPLQPGTRVTLPGMARLLEEFADRGAALFHGRIGGEVAAYVAERGGVLTTEDFSLASAEWLPAVGSDVQGRRLWTTPAPTHGPTLHEAMSRIRPDGGPAAVWDAVLAGIGSRSVLSDPAGTSMVSAADHSGTVVVVIHSNSFPRFGSGLVVPQHDLILSNRAGRGFTDEPGHPNFPAVGRRPATTLHAWALDGADETVAGGTPGGDNQMPWNAQILAQLLAGEDDPGMLVVSPRWEWQPGDGMVIEEGFAPEDEDALIARAPRAGKVPRWGLASAQQIVRSLDDGRVVGAVDPRTGGAGVPV